MGKGCLLGFIWEIKSLGDGRLCSANKVNIKSKNLLFCMQKNLDISPRDLLEILILEI